MHRMWLGVLGAACCRAELRPTPRRAARAARAHQCPGGTPSSQAVQTALLLHYPIDQALVRAHSRAHQPTDHPNDHAGAPDTHRAPPCSMPAQEAHQYCCACQQRPNSPGEGSTPRKTRTSAMRIEPPSHTRPPTHPVSGSGCGSRMISAVQAQLRVAPPHGAALLPGANACHAPSARPHSPACSRRQATLLGLVANVAGHQHRYRGHEEQPHQPGQEDGGEAAGKLPPAH
jgi:hypothetical protein